MCKTSFTIFVIISILIVAFSCGESATEPSTTQDVINITDPTSSTIWNVGDLIGVDWNGAEGSTVDVFSQILQEC